MTTSAKTITIGGVSSTSKVDAMGKTENGKTGKSEIAQNLLGSPTTAARRRVTLRDVATAAGVSLKTASNVINGTGRMTDATRQRGYLVYVTTYAEGSATGARELLRNFNTTVSDGMILSMSEVEDINPEDLEVDFPLVVVGARTTWGKADHATPNDVQAAASAAGYMFDCGVKSLAVVGGRGAYDEAKLLGAVEGNAQLRLRGIIEECRRRGMTLDARLVGNVEQEWTIGAGAHATQELIDKGVPFDGVIGLNDQLAIGALTVMRANGIEIPRQVQVIGFDNIEESQYLQIPLTTMDSRLEWTAPTAVERILGRIRGEIAKPELLMTDCNVIVRDSTR